jgi:hypothetical protein
MAGIRLFLTERLRNREPRLSRQARLGDRKFPEGEGKETHYTASGNWNLLGGWEESDATERRVWQYVVEEVGCGGRI